jgi:hypothetical protein
VSDNNKPISRSDDCVATVLAFKREVYLSETIRERHCFAPLLGGSASCLSAISAEIVLADDGKYPCPKLGLMQLKSGDAVILGRAGYGTAQMFTESRVLMAVLAELIRRATDRAGPTDYSD